MNPETTNCIFCAKLARTKQLHFVANGQFVQVETHGLNNKKGMVITNFCYVAETSLALQITKAHEYNLQLKV